MSILFPHTDDDSDSGSTDDNIVSQPETPSYSEDNTESIVSLILNKSPLDEVDIIVQKILSSYERRETLKRALDKSLQEINTQTEIASGIESYIDSYMEKYSLNDDETTHSNSYVEYIKALIIQDMLKGVTSHRVTLNPSPINMQVGEVPIWPFLDVVYYEELTQRSMVGASRGISIKVAKGIYYKVGAFKGEPLITSSLRPKYGGALIFTNKNIYFYSTEKTMRFPYKKIVSYVPFEDGIGIQQDKANAKTIYFKGIDGRFAFNIVSNIKNLS